MHSTASISNPFDSASATAASKLSFFLLQITTFAPALAKANAMALPIPLDPPEIITLLFFKLNIYFFSHLSAIAFHIYSGSFVKSENSPAPASHSPPSMVITSPLI